MYFNGTMEHWLIQLDYLSQHPNEGEREYKIPAAGPNGGFGYADVVNLSTREIFEIKPLSLTGVGIAEVENYVLKANINCSSSGNSNIPWQKGFSVGYSPRYLSWPKDPTKTLFANSTYNGIINYAMIPSIPNPNPIVIPQSIIDKIKDLFERLQKYPNLNKEYEIAIFLKENPSLIQIINVTAISLVVGTIVEDLLTAGFGIADDWGSFVLAYKLARVASIY